MLKHRDLGHAGERPSLAPREILELPEVRDGIHRKDGRGIIALLLDQLVDLRRRPGGELGHRRDQRLHQRIWIGLLLGRLGRRLIPPISILSGHGRPLILGLHRQGEGARGEEGRAQ
ncbi:hypothetical protein D9M73_235500 [compost metagenome]